MAKPKEKGPKESSYVLAFKSALERMLTSFTIQIWPEYGTKSKSCDMILSILGETIAIEHGANLNVDPNSVQHHVKSQAELYHTGLKANQTWMIKVR